VVTTVFEPMEVGDHLRAIIYDGDHLVGYVGLARRGSQERFRKEEEQSLQQCLPQIKAVLATADTLESQLYGEGVFGLLDARGNIEYATSALVRWLTDDRRLYLQRRLGMIDLGTMTCGAETFQDTEVRIVRMEGASGSRYFVTVERVRSLRLTARMWLSDRQIAAAAGATVDEIARALRRRPRMTGLSPSFCVSTPKNGGLWSVFPGIDPQERRPLAGFPAIDSQKNIPRAAVAACSPPFQTSIGVWKSRFIPGSRKVLRGPVDGPPT
jgi:Holliday junction resolvase-like predicted endonuclease